jgi:tetratricopeptide (TPR) repeat protein
MHSITRLFALLAMVLMVLMVGCKSPYVSSANIYLDQQNNPDKAEGSLQKALEQNPNDPEAHFLMGRVHRIRGDYGEMAASFNRSLELSNAFKGRIDQIREDVWMDLYNSDAVEKFNEADYESAIEALELAVVVLPTRWETYNLMAIAYENIDNPEKAAEQYQKAIDYRKDEKDLNLYYNLANVLYRLKRYEEANDYARVVAEETPDDSLRLDAAKISAVALGNLGRSGEALAIYNEIIQSSPNDPNPYFDRAILHMELGDTNSAVADLEKVVELDPDDADALKQLGLIYLESVDYIDYRKALDYYMRANELQPHTYIVVRGIGKALVNLDRAEEASVYLKEATALLQEMKKK